MATIHLNSKDLHTMIREAVERLCEEHMNQKKIELEPLYEFAHKAAKKALREALSSQANTNTFGTRKSRKNDFCA